MSPAGDRPPADPRRGPTHRRPYRQAAGTAGGTIAANAADEFNLFNGTYTDGTALQQDNVNTLASTFPSTVTLAITLNGVDPSIDLAADLDLYVTENSQGVGNSFNANFGDGVTFTINAPPGVIVTSDSGVFPDTAATPLPAALPLFATGLGGLGLLGWRRKRKFVPGAIAA